MTPTPEILAEAERLAGWAYTTISKEFQQFRDEIAQALQAKDDAAKAENEILTDAIVKISFMTSEKKAFNLACRVLEHLEIINAEKAEIQKLQDAARPLGASGDLASVQPGNGPLPCNAYEIADALAERIFQEYVKPPAMHAKPFAEMRQWIRDALKAAGDVVPEGWKCVPINPTREMIDAFYDCQRFYTDESLPKPSVNQAHFKYVNMLEQSPVYPLKSEQEVAQKARKEIIEQAAKLAVRVPADFLNMGHEQKMYGWHDVMNALTKASETIRKLIGEDVG